MCSVFISEQRANSAPYNINWLVLQLRWKVFTARYDWVFKYSGLRSVCKGLMASRYQLLGGKCALFLALIDPEDICSMVLPNISYYLPVKMVWHPTEDFSVVIHCIIHSGYIIPAHILKISDKLSADTNYKQLSWRPNSRPT